MSGVDYFFDIVAELVGGGSVIKLNLGCIGETFLPTRCIAIEEFLRNMS